MELNLLPRLQQHLYNNEPLSGFAFADEEEKLISGYPFLTRKEWVIAISVGDNHIRNHQAAHALKTEFSLWNHDMLCMSTRIEGKLLSSIAASGKLS